MTTTPTNINNLMELLNLNSNSNNQTIPETNSPKVSCVLQWKHSTNHSNYDESKTIDAVVAKKMEDGLKDKKITNIVIEPLGNQLPEHIGLVISNIENKIGTNLNMCYAKGGKEYNCVLSNGKISKLFNEVTSNEFTISKFNKDCKEVHPGIYELLGSSETIQMLKNSGADAILSTFRPTEMDGVTYYKMSEDVKQKIERSIISLNSNKNKLEEVELPSISNIQFQLVPLVHDNFTDLFDNSISIHNLKAIKNNTQQVDNHEIILFVSVEFENENN